MMCMGHRELLHLAWIILLGWVIAPGLHAQVETITIQGTITNARGAALPGAMTQPRRMIHAK